MDNNVFERDILDYVGDNQVLRNKILKSRMIGKPITLDNLVNNSFLTEDEVSLILYNGLIVIDKDFKNRGISIEEFKQYFENVDNALRHRK